LEASAETDALLEHKTVAVPVYEEKKKLAR
jgi:hypothetical protein